MNRISTIQGHGQPGCRRADRGGAAAHSMAALLKRVFIFIALMLTTASGAWAVDVIEEGTDYYILHEKSGLFLGAQNNYGTQGTLSTDAGIFKFLKGTTGEGYNIANTLITASNKNLGNNLYMDRDGKLSVKDNEEAGTTKSVDGIWSIVDQGGGIFAFHCESRWDYYGSWVETKYGYLSMSEAQGAKKGYTLAFSESLTDDCLFLVLTREEAMAYVATQAEKGPVSYNFLIKNPDFCRNQTTEGWTVSADCTNKNLAAGGYDAYGNFVAESNKSPFTISQVVRDLPAGQYQLTAQAFYSGEGDGEIPYLFAGENKANFPANNGETNTTTASNSFKAGKYQIAPITFVLKEKADVEVGFHSSTSQYWCVFDNIELTYTGPVPTYSVALADGTEDAANWQAKVGSEGAFTVLPVTGLEGGETVTIQYNGTRRIKSITAVQEAAAEEQQEQAVTTATPLTMECLTDGTIKVDMGSGTLSTGMQYAVNGGAKTKITTTTTIDGLKTGDKVQFYGVGTSTQAYGDVPVVISGGTATVKVYGNIMSLVDETGFATKTDLPSSDNVFYALFSGNANLTDASGLLLPATTLANSCYAYMFYGCTALTAAPALPATTLADYCYYGMFYGCTALTAAPELPATTLAKGCYYEMFRGCSKLASVTCKATDITATDCLANWLKNAGTDESVTSPTLYVDPTMTSNTGWNNREFFVTAITQ